MLSQVIFTSLIVHRMKDVNDNVRAVALEHLYDFIIFDPLKALKEDNLKYIGFACFDHSALVRLTAVKLLVKLLEVR